MKTVITIIATLGTIFVVSMPIFAAGSLGATTVDDLIAIVQNPNLSDLDKIPAINKLGESQSDDFEVVYVLRGIVINPSFANPVTNTLSSIRFSALIALRKIGTVSSANALKEIIIELSRKDAHSLPDSLGVIAEARRQLQMLASQNVFPHRVAKPGFFNWFCDTLLR